MVGQVETKRAWRPCPGFSRVRSHLSADRSPQAWGAARDCAWGVDSRAKGLGAPRSSLIRVGDDAVLGRFGGHDFGHVGRLLQLVVARGPEPMPLAHRRARPFGGIEAVGEGFRRAVCQCGPASAGGPARRARRAPNAVYNRRFPSSVFGRKRIMHRQTARILFLADTPSCLNPSTRPSECRRIWSVAAWR